MQENVFVFDHPLIQHKVSLLRDENTSTKEFRELVSEIAMLMAYGIRYENSAYQQGSGNNIVDDRFYEDQDSRCRS